VRQLGPATGLQLALASLGRRWLTLDQEITSLDAAITTTLRRTAPKLLERHSVGVQTAAQLLITAGDNPTGCTARPPSPPCAAPAGPGVLGQDHPAPTKPRRRPRGQQRAVPIANNRLMHEPRSRAYAAKRTAMGNSRKEILRWVQPALARELYPLILDTLTPTTPSLT
jgi:transposase